VCLLLQVLDRGHQLNRVYDTVVVKQHTGDLAGSFSVLRLDELVNGVANLLALLGGVQRVETVNVHRWKLLLHLLHLLLEELRLVGGHWLTAGLLGT